MFWIDYAIAEPLRLEVVAGRVCDARRRSVSSLHCVVNVLCRTRQHGVQSRLVESITHTLSHQLTLFLYLRRLDNISSIVSVVAVVVIVAVRFVRHVLACGCRRSAFVVFVIPSDPHRLVYVRCHQLLVHGSPVSGYGAVSETI